MRLRVVLPRRKTQKLRNMALVFTVRILTGSAVPVPIGLSKLVQVIMTELLSSLTERYKSLLPELSLRNKMEH